MAKKINRMRSIRGKVEDIQEEEKINKNNYHVQYVHRKTLPKALQLENLLTFKQPLADASLYFTGMEMSSVIEL